MKCEMCPIHYHCPAYKKAVEDNDGSYHRQTVVRVDYPEDCPLVKLIKKEKRIKSA